MYCKHKFTKIRALQRYRVELSDDDIDHMVSSIERGRSRMLERQSSRISVHTLDVKGVEMAVVYDNRRHIPVTVLSDEQVALLVP